MVVAALAGRRIDAQDVCVERFPARNAAEVQRRIRAALEALDVTTLVSAAACGVDLLALEAAGDLGIRRRVVLPFPPARFRETSVTDRPGDWGELFDRVIAPVQAAGDLVILHLETHPDAAYVTGNLAILDEAEALARHNDGASSAPSSPNQIPEDQVIAVAVWDRASRGESDMTEHFARNAAARGLKVFEVLTT